MARTPKPLFPDASHRSPTTVRLPVRVCAVCEEEREIFAMLYASAERTLSWCHDCEPYMLVVLPMAKVVRENSQKGTLP